MHNVVVPNKFAVIPTLGGICYIEAVCFFLSDKAKHITGQTLIVDGGWTSVSPPPQA